MLIAGDLDQNIELLQRSITLENEDIRSLQYSGKKLEKALEHIEFCAKHLRELVSRKAELALECR